MLSCAIPFNPIYHITIDGRVINTKTDYELKQHKDFKGYMATTLSKNGKVKTFKIHRLLCEAFLPHNECFSNIQIDHINRKKDDNRLINLRMTNPSHNMINRDFPVGKSGIKNIIKRENRYVCRICRNNRFVIDKSFKNLEDAIRCRDEYLIRFRTGLRE
jgi:tricorn protease-like protein